MKYEYLLVNGNKGNTTVAMCDRANRLQSQEKTWTVVRMF